MRCRTLFLFGFYCIAALSQAFGLVASDVTMPAGSPSGAPEISFLVGFKGGVNFSPVSPTQRYSVLQSVDPSETTQNQKVYEPFYRNFGYQYGFVGLCKLNESLSLSLEPSFSDYSVQYYTEGSWSDIADPSDRIRIRDEFVNRLKYFEIPLIIRYEFNRGRFRPFLAAGVFYGLLTAAPARSVTTVMHITGDLEMPLETGETAGDIAGNFITSRFAVFPGFGVSYATDFLTLYLEGDYFFGLHNIVNESARYYDQQMLGGTYNVPDNLRFDNLVFNLGVLFNINRIKAGSAVECPTPIRKR